MTRQEEIASAFAKSTPASSAEQLAWEEGGDWPWCDPTYYYTEMADRPAWDPDGYRDSSEKDRSFIDTIQPNSEEAIWPVDREIPPFTNAVSAIWTPFSGADLAAPISTTQPDKKEMERIAAEYDARTLKVRQQILALYVRERVRLRRSAARHAAAVARNERLPLAQNRPAMSDRQVRILVEAMSARTDIVDGSVTMPQIGQRIYAPVADVTPDNLTDQMLSLTEQAALTVSLNINMKKNV